MLGFQYGLSEKMSLVDRVREHVQEVIELADIPRGNVLASSPEEVRDWMRYTLEFSPEDQPFVYVSGGLECGPQHEVMIRLVSRFTNPWMPFTMWGLESDGWIKENKGRDPLVELPERIAFWLRASPSPTCIFVVPPGTEDYDDLSKRVGSYRHPHVIHLGYVGDAPLLSKARRERAATPRHFWNLAIGLNPHGIMSGVMINEWHTSDLLAGNLDYFV